MTAEQWLARSQQEDADVDRCQEKARPLHADRALLYAMYALFEQQRQQATFDRPVTVQGDLNIT